VKPALIDTDIISLFLRNHPQVVLHFEKYLKTYRAINFSIITYYEIMSGLKYKDAKRQLKSFLELTNKSTIVLATETTIDLSAEIYANLRKKGTLIDDIDILIAGIALANNTIGNTQFKPFQKN